MGLEGGKKLIYGRGERCLMAEKGGFRAFSGLAGMREQDFYCYLLLSSAAKAFVLFCDFIKP